MDEVRRLDEPAGTGWKLCGPYLSERQWGTVREDYSPGATAWDSFSHDAARSRANRLDRPRGETAAAEAERGVGASRG